MTKEKMAERIKELEDQLGIVTKPTKMQEIKALETETMVSVKDLIRNCEKITGRELKAVNSKDVFSGDIRNCTGPLRCMVEELRDFAMNSGNYDFDSDLDLANWVKSKLTQ